MGWIASVIRSVSNAVSKAWSAVKSVASSVGNYVGGFVSNVWSGITRISSNVGSFVGQGVKKVSSSVSNIISSISKSRNQYYSPSSKKYYDLKTEEKEAKEAKNYDKLSDVFRNVWENFKRNLIHPPKIEEAAPPGAPFLERFLTFLTTLSYSNVQAGTVPLGPVGVGAMVRAPSGAIVGAKYLNSTTKTAKLAAVTKIFKLGKTVIKNLGKAMLRNPIITIFAATEIPQLIVMWGFLKKWKTEQRGESLTSTSIMMGKLEKRFDSVGYAFRDALEAGDQALADKLYADMESLVTEYAELINSKADVLENAGELDMAYSLLSSFSTILGKMRDEIDVMGVPVEEEYEEYFEREKKATYPVREETSASSISYNLDQLHDFFGDLEWGIKSALEEKNYQAAEKTIENMNTIKGAYDKILNNFQSVLKTAGIYGGKKATSDVMGDVIKRYEEKIPLSPEALDELIGLTVREVIDGDSIRSHYKDFTYDIRLVGINAPELAHTVEGVYRSAETGAKESKNWLAGLIWGQDVVVKIDPDNAVDKYGRILGTIFLGDININLESVKEGWAMYYPYDANKYVDGMAYESADKLAKENKKGVWSLMQGVGKINVTSSPNYAEIFIDGEDTMVLTSQTFRDVSVGKHEIYVVKYDWVSDTVEVDVEAGKEYDVRFEK